MLFPRMSGSKARPGQLPVCPGRLGCGRSGDSARRGDRRIEAPDGAARDVRAIPCWEAVA